MPELKTNVLHYGDNLDILRNHIRNYFPAMEGTKQSRRDFTEVILSAAKNLQPQI